MPMRLAHPGNIHRLLVDTAHFKGNYPDRCSVEGALLAPDADCNDSNINWQTLLPEQKLSADAIHEYQSELTDSGPFSHLRLRIYPDGGISRLRAFGTIAR